MSRRFLSRHFAALIAAAGLMWSASCGTEDPAPPPTTDPPETVSRACAEGRTLRFGFFASYDPVSYNADPDPDSPGFGEHLGYEADLLTALEEMQGAGLQFSRTPITDWPDIWLRAAGPDFDIMGGGITIREARTYDAQGDQVVAFTSGHITFRQSLLVRSEDADRYAAYEDLTSNVRVGVAPSTTGEGRLLLLTGLRDSEGRLAAGTQVVTDTETLVADGSDRFVITPAGSSPDLEGRLILQPPSPDMPVVVFLDESFNEEAIQRALREGTIDAHANEEIGNLEAVFAQEDEEEFAITAHDTMVEWGGWTLPVTERELLDCLNDKLDYLTDQRNIGFSEWRSDPQVFLRRARTWSP